MVKAVATREAQEVLIPASEVPDLKWLPRRRSKRRRGNGRMEGRLNASTVYRWILTGANGVRLKAVRVGGTWCVTESGLRRFFEESAAADLRLRPPTDGAAQAAAERSLKATGAM